MAIYLITHLSNLGWEWVGVTGQELQFQIQDSHSPESERLKESRKCYPTQLHSHQDHYPKKTLQKQHHQALSSIL